MDFSNRNNREMTIIKAKLRDFSHSKNWIRPKQLDSNLSSQGAIRKLMLLICWWRIPKSWNYKKLFYQWVAMHVIMKTNASNMLTNPSWYSRLTIKSSPSLISKERISPLSRVKILPFSIGFIRSQLELRWVYKERVSEMLCASILEELLNNQ